MTSKTRVIIQRLAAFGVQGTFVSDISDGEDGEIRITPTVSVQVGHDYLIAVLADSPTDLTAIRQYPPRSTRELSYLVEDINMAKIFDFNAEPVFKRVDRVWQIEVYQGPNGGSIIERWRGPKGTKPQMWQSERSPEDWVSIQRGHTKYRRVEVTA